MRKLPLNCQNWTLDVFGGVDVNLSLEIWVALCKKYLMQFYLSVGFRFHQKKEKE